MAQHDLASKLRTAGLVMLLAAPTIYTARRRLAHLRALLNEEESSLLIRLDDPGSLLAHAGVTLMELARGLRH